MPVKRLDSVNFMDFEALSRDYARYHTHPMNRLCHAFGIPLIMFCVVRWTQFGATPLPWACAALILYAFWDASLAVVMAAVIFAMALIAQPLPAWAIWSIFGFGWVLQLAGHRYFEKQSPAFTRNIIHLLVGPMWILGELLGD